MERTFCFIDDLRQALTNIAGYPPDADPDVDLRVKAALQLAAVLTFFRGHPEIEKHLSHLVDLQIALEDVQNGHPVLWLTPTKKRGQPPIAAETAILRGRYVWVMEFLMNAGWTEQQAAAYVARHGDIARLVPKERRRKAAPHKTVRSWRTQAMGNSGSGDYARLRAGFEYQRQRLGDVDGGDAEAAALVWLMALAKI